MEEECQVSLRASRKGVPRPWGQRANAAIPWSRRGRQETARRSRPCLDRRGPAARPPEQAAFAKVRL